MKRFGFLQVVVLIAVAAIISSCSSGRRYHDYPPPPPARTSVSLILHSGPGMVVSRYPDGRYYYRSPQGYMYWRGYDNRYYLDRRYVKRSYGGHYQYRDWKRYHGRRR